MSETTRKYLYLGLLAGAAILLIAGAVVLGMAVSFEGYVTALMLWALAGCGVVGAREFKQWTPRAAMPAFSPSPDAEHHSQSSASTSEQHPTVADGH
jgi:predicted small lipoprotein YifL